MRDMIIQERDERKDQADKIDKFFNNENDARKKNLDDVNEWIGVENAKRFVLFKHCTIGGRKFWVGIS